MNKRNRTQLALGLLLVLLGVFFVVERQVPAVREWIAPLTTFPVNIIAIGGGILVLGLLVGAPGLAVPASIVAGIGGILYYQTITEDFTSWSYMWTLIPGFVGVGSLLAGLLGDGRRAMQSGLNLIVISAVMFLIFGAAFGGLDILGDYGVGVILALLGLFIIGRGLVGSHRSKSEE
ncbi:MAG: hypothetical protein WHV44_01135 [Anaerolineales bacterium]